MGFNRSTYNPQRDAVESVPQMLSRVNLNIGDTCAVFSGGIERLYRLVKYPATILGNWEQIGGDGYTPGGGGGGGGSWNDLTDKPATFPPSTHTHPWADVTSKPAIIDSLVAAVGDGALIKTGTNVSTSAATSVGLAVLAAADPAAARAAIGASDGSVIKTFTIVADQPERLALASSLYPQAAYQENNSLLYVLAEGADPSVGANWRATGGIVVVSFNGRTGAVVPMAGDYTATLITFAPTGSISATTVQGAIAELDGDLTALTATVAALASTVASLSETAPVTVSSSNYTVGATDDALVFDNAATTTLTLPAPALSSGRKILVKRLNAFTVVSATANVKPIGSATPGTAILPATAGAWATLVSDGAAWVVMADSSASGGGGGVALVAAGQAVTTPIVTAGANGTTGAAATAARSDHTHPDRAITSETAFTPNATFPATPLNSARKVLVSNGTANESATIADILRGQAIRGMAFFSTVSRVINFSGSGAFQLPLPGATITSPYAVAGTILTAGSSVPNLQFVTLVGNSTITLPSSHPSANPNNKVSEDIPTTNCWHDLTLVLQQDSTGGRTCSVVPRTTPFGGHVDVLFWDGSPAMPSINTAPDAFTMFHFVGWSDGAVIRWFGARIFQQV